jgi:hypothetical protein
VPELSECETCGQVDDHPKHIYAASVTSRAHVYHHDCLPAAVERDVTEHAASHPVHAANAEHIRLAKSGVRGAKLRTAIGEHHEKVAGPAIRKLHAKLEREGGTITVTTAKG